MEFYFIRHAETVFNVEGRYYGQMNPDLTEEGIAQLKELAKELSTLEIDRIVVSGLDRTIQSAEIIAAENGWDQDLIEEHAGLNELDFGAWEGLKANEIETTYANDWATFMTKPLAFQPTEGELFEAFRERVLKVFSEIIETANPDAKILFVGHLGVLRLIIQQYFEPEMDYFDINFAKEASKHYTLGA